MYIYKCILYKPDKIFYTNQVNYYSLKHNQTIGILWHHELSSTLHTNTPLYLYCALCLLEYKPDSYNCRSSC